MVMFFYKPRPCWQQWECLEFGNNFIALSLSLSLAFCRPVGTPFEDGKFSILIYLVHKVQAQWEHIYPSSGFD